MPLSTWAIPPSTLYSIGKPRASTFRLSKTHRKNGSVSRWTQRRVQYVPFSSPNRNNFVTLFLPGLEALPASLSWPGAARRGPGKSAKGMAYFL